MGLHTSLHYHRPVIILSSTLYIAQWGTVVSGLLSTAVAAICWVHMSHYTEDRHSQYSYSGNNLPSQHIIWGVWYNLKETEGKSRCNVSNLSSLLNNKPYHMEGTSQQHCLAFFFFFYKDLTEKYNFKVNEMHLLYSETWTLTGHYLWTVTGYTCVWRVQPQYFVFAAVLFLNI